MAAANARAVVRSRSQRDSFFTVRVQVTLRLRTAKDQLISRSERRARKMLQTMRTRDELDSVHIGSTKQQFNFVVVERSSPPTENC